MIKHNTAAKKRGKECLPNGCSPKRTYCDGELSKPILITIITVAAIAVLLLFIFFKGQFVGKATEFQAIMVGEMGVAGTVTEGNLGTAYSFPIRANFPDGKQSVAVAFNAEIPSGMSVNCDSILSAMDKQFGNLYLERKASCDNNKIKFFYVGLCKDETCSNALSGKDIVVAEVNFIFSQEGKFNLQNFQGSVLDLTSSQNLIRTFVGGPIVFKAAVAEQPPEPESIGTVCSDSNCETEKGEDCISCPEDCGACPTTSETGFCNDQLDNDQDGSADCDDLDCVDDDACVIPTIRLCEINGASDTDCDSIIDVADNCLQIENNDQADTDGDGVGDVCDDTMDVVEAPDIPVCFNNMCEAGETCTSCPADCGVCPLASETGLCDDLLDNDQDNSADCDDLDCASDIACVIPTSQVCAIGADSDTDCDGIIDTADNCPQIENIDQADTDGDGVGDVCDDTVAVAEAPEISIKVFNAAGTEVASVAAGQSYTIQVKVTAKDNVNPYLALAKVSYAGLQSTQYADNKPTLIAGTSDTFEFTHTVPQKTGKMKVSVFAWNNWLSPEVEWFNILDSAEVEYNVQ